MERSTSLATGAVIGYFLHKKMDWILTGLYNKHPASSRMIVGISVGMGIYFLTQELPRLIKKLKFYYL